MDIIKRLRMTHRFWRYRLRTERSSIGFLLQQRLLGQVVLDVGANLGIYSYWMSKAVGREGRVVAFEPQPELTKHLADLKDTFGLANLEIVNKGLSSAVARTQLYRPEAGSGAGSLDCKSDAWQSIDVDLVTLDGYYDSPRPVKFIKCDVEGHEYHVLLGARRILLRDKPTLLLEIHHAEAVKGDIASYLADLAYEGFFFNGNDRISFARFKQFPYRKSWESHRNYIFVHNDAARRR
jgi:FkbM family methyltransferase